MDEVKTINAVAGVEKAGHKLSAVQNAMLLREQAEKAPTDEKAGQLVIAARLSDDGMMYVIEIPTSVDGSVCIQAAAPNVKTGTVKSLIAKFRVEFPPKSLQEITWPDREDGTKRDPTYHDMKPLNINAVLPIKATL